MYKVMFEYKDGRSGNCIDNGMLLTFETFEEADSYAKNRNSMIDDEVREYLPTYKAVKVEANDDVSKSKLKAMRERVGMSQSQLAEKSGVSVRMIQHYEQGVKDLGKAQAITVLKLTRVLRCRIEDLIEE